MTKRVQCGGLQISSVLYDLVNTEIIRKAGMKVAVDVMSNHHVKQQVLQASDNVREGASLRKALDQTKLFHFF